MVYEIAATIMEYYEPIQALVGTVLFAIVTYYSYQILQNFEDHHDYSLVMFFVDEKASYAFWILASSAIIFSLGMAMGNLGMVYANELLGVLALLSSFVLFLGLGYFAVNIADVTTKKKKVPLLEEEN